MAPIKREELFDALEKAYKGERPPFGTRINSGKLGTIEAVGGKNIGYLALIRLGKLRGLTYITQKKAGTEVKQAVVRAGDVPTDIVGVLRKISKTNLENVPKKTPRIETPELEGLIKIGAEYNISPSEIAKIFGVGKITVLNISRRLGIKHEKN